MAEVVTTLLSARGIHIRPNQAKTQRVGSPLTIQLMQPQRRPAWERPCHAEF